MVFTKVMENYEKMGKASFWSGSAMLLQIVVHLPFLETSGLLGIHTVTALTLSLENKTCEKQNVVQIACKTLNFTCNVRAYCSTIPCIFRIPSFGLYDSLFPPPIFLASSSGVHTEEVQKVPIVQKNGLQVETPNLFISIQWPLTRIWSKVCVRIQINQKCCLLLFPSVFSEHWSCRNVL